MRRIGLLVLVYLALILQSGLGEPARVSIVRPSRFIPERAAVRWMVQVQPAEENRRLELAAFDDGVEVSMSKRQLDGAEAPKTWWITWAEGLPAGEYMLVASVHNSSREVARASVPVTVLARF
jgi:hypothetical protein